MSYVNYEDAKTRYILDVCDLYAGYCQWNALNLRGALQRELWTELSIYDQRYNSTCFNLPLGLSRKSKLILAPHVLVYGYKITKKWLRRILDLAYHKQSLYRRPPLSLILVAACHPKFVQYFKCSELYDREKIVWLVNSESHALSLGLEAGAYITILDRFFHYTDSSIFGRLKNTALSLQYILDKIKPSSVIMFEGDTSCNSILGELCKKNSIDSHCYQWGIFGKNRKLINFSHMSCKYFYAWGEYFVEDIKHLNKDVLFIASGKLVRANIRSSGSRIIFFDHGGASQYVNVSDYQRFVNIACELGNIYRNQIAWREHPSSRIDAITKRRLLDSNVCITDTELTIDQTLEKADIAIAMTSSSLLDALYHKVVPVAFTPDMNLNYPVPLVESGCGFECRSEFEVIATVKLLKGSADYRQRVHQQIESAYSHFFTVKLNG